MVIITEMSLIGHHTGVKRLKKGQLSSWWNFVRTDSGRLIIMDGLIFSLRMRGWDKTGVEISTILQSRADHLVKLRRERPKCVWSPVFSWFMPGAFRMAHHSVSQQGEMWCVGGGGGRGVLRDRVSFHAARAQTGRFHQGTEQLVHGAVVRGVVTEDRTDGLITLSQTHSLTT